MLRRSDENTCWYLRRLIAGLGYVPSYSQMALALGLSKGSIQTLMARLELKGYVTKEPGKARTFKLTGKDLPADANTTTHVFTAGQRLQEDKLTYTVYADIWNNLRRVFDPEDPGVPKEQSPLLEAKTGFEVVIRRLP